MLGAQQGRDVSSRALFLMESCGSGWVKYGGDSGNLFSERRASMTMLIDYPIWFVCCDGQSGQVNARVNGVPPVTTKAQQNAENADSAENAEVKSAILLGFLLEQWKT